MSFYLDTNVIMSLFFEDDHSSRVDSWLSLKPRNIVLSHWAETEFTAIVMRRTRTAEISFHDAASVLSSLKSWIVRRTERAEFPPGAGQLATLLTSLPELKLSAPDALHLALSASGGYILVTLDKRLADAAAFRGYPVEMP